MIGNWISVSGDVPPPKGKRVFVASRVPGGHFVEVGHLTIYGWHDDQAKPIRNVEYFCDPKMPGDA